MNKLTGESGERQACCKGKGEVRQEARAQLVARLSHTVVSWKLMRSGELGLQMILEFAFGIVCPELPVANRINVILGYVNREQAEGRDFHVV